MRLPLCVRVCVHAPQSERLDCFVVEVCILREHVVAITLSTNPEKRFLSQRWMQLRKP